MTAKRFREIAVGTQFTVPCPKHPEQTNLWQLEKIRPYAVLLEDLAPSPVIYREGDTEFIDPAAQRMAVYKFVTKPLDQWPDDAKLYMLNEWDCNCRKNSTHE